VNPACQRFITGKAIDAKEIKGEKIWNTQHIPDAAPAICRFLLCHAIKRHFSCHLHAMCNLTQKMYCPAMAGT